MNSKAPIEPGLNVKHCDACKTTVGPFRTEHRSGFTLNVCVEWRACIARTPSIDRMAGGIRR